MYRRDAVTILTAFAAVALIPAASVAAPPDDASVADALEAMRQAMLSADEAALQALFLPDGTYGHSDGRLQPKDQFIADTVAKKTVWKSITLSDPRIAVSGDTAIVRVLFVGEAEQHGKTVTPRITVLIVYRRQNGAWKILTRQGYETH
jgi:ketosteroid isomerase-like protein